MKNLVNREIANLLYAFPPLVAEMAKGRNEAEEMRIHRKYYKHILKVKCQNLAQFIKQQAA